MGSVIFNKAERKVSYQELRNQVVNLHHIQFTAQPFEKFLLLASIKRQSIETSLVPQGDSEQINHDKCILKLATQFVIPLTFTKYSHTLSTYPISQCFDNCYSL